MEFSAYDVLLEVASALGVLDRLVDDQGHMLEDPQFISQILVQAVYELKSSHRALTQARDENSQKIIDFRDDKFVLMDRVQRLLTQVDDLSRANAAMNSKLLASGWKPSEI